MLLMSVFQPDDMQPLSKHFTSIVSFQNQEVLGINLCGTLNFKHRSGYSKITRSRRCRL